MPLPVHLHSQVQTFKEPVMWMQPLLLLLLFESERFINALINLEPGEMACVSMLFDI